MTPQERLGANIRKRRLYTKPFYNQTLLAEKVGCSTGHLSDIERGYKGPSIWLLRDIARELKTTMDKLISE